MFDYVIHKTDRHQRATVSLSYRQTLHLTGWSAGDGTVNGLGAEQQFANGGMGAVPQREADLLHLYTAVQRADSPAAKVQALEALHAETDQRLRIDKGIRVAVGQLLRQPAVLSSFQVRQACTSPAQSRHARAANLRICTHASAGLDEVCEMYAWASGCCQ